jgi:putative salt-induced outer membrane protein YdiY
VIILDNGDHVTGEIKKLERGKLTLKTDFMGTLEIEWEHIEKVESEFFYEVELSSGVKYFGSIKTAEEERKLEVTSAYSQQETDQSSVVEMTPIRKRFFDRLNFSVDAGFNYTRANRSTEFNLGSSADYRVEKYLLTGNYSSLFKQQGESEGTARNELGVNFLRFLKRRWFVVGLSQFLQSDELSLDLRSMFGGGAGRSLIHTNSMVFSVFGGAVVNREQYVEEPIHTSGEGLVGIRFQTFKFRNPEMDITTSFNTIPSLSDWGRVRLDFDTQVRIEIIKDLYFKIALFDNYDSRPPGDAEKNDFGINTGVGWSF